MAICAILPVAAAASELTDQPSPNTIRVVADATVAAKPDQAELDLGVTTNRKTATAAVAENAHKMEQVLAALKKEIGPDGELKTSEISVQPRFERTKDWQVTARVLGYTATNTVRVRVANIRSVGRILDLAIQSGANTVERAAFTLKDPEPAQTQALRAASAKARARATAMAEGQGLHVGEVVSVTEEEKSRFADYEEGGGYRVRSANVVAMPIEWGSVEVHARVTVIFGLKTR